MTEGEPGIGAVVTEGAHVWLHRRNGAWSGCITCGDDDIGWSWEEVRADIGRAPYRVVLP